MSMRDYYINMFNGFEVTDENYKQINEDYVGKTIYLTGGEVTPRNFNVQGAFYGYPVFFKGIYKNNISMFVIQFDNYVEDKQSDLLKSECKDVRIKNPYLHPELGYSKYDREIYVNTDEERVKEDYNRFIKSIESEILNSYKRGLKNFKSRVRNDVVDKDRLDKRILMLMVD